MLETKSYVGREKAQAGYEEDVESRCTRNAASDRHAERYTALFRTKSTIHYPPAKYSMAHIKWTLIAWLFLNLDL